MAANMADSGVCTQGGMELLGGPTSVAAGIEPVIEILH